MRQNRSYRNHSTANLPNYVPLRVNTVTGLMLQSKTKPTQSGTFCKTQRPSVLGTTTNTVRLGCGVCLHLY